MQNGKKFKKFKKFKNRISGLRHVGMLDT